MIFDLQKASMWKRISAFLFDFILFGIVAVLFAWLLSAALGFDAHYQTLVDAYARYGQTYGVDFSMSSDAYEALTEEQLQDLQDAYAALAADGEAVYAYNMTVQLAILITSLGILLAFLAMEFAVPLALGDGQTLGKKIFSLGLMRQDGVRVRAVALFVRAVLGKYAIETMVPLLIVAMILYGSIGIVGPVILGLLLLVQAAVLCATPTRAAIHDLLAATVVVDLPSQKIFDTREELIACRQRLHAEKVASEPYR